MEKYCVYKEQGPSRPPLAVSEAFDDQAAAQDWQTKQQLTGDEYTIGLVRALKEQHEPMSLLKEVFNLIEGKTKKKPTLKKAAHAVYHRDYLKTKNKPYRKYDPQEHSPKE